MKFKALRFKNEPKEFVEITNIGGVNMLFTSELPNPQPMTATIELMKKYFEQQSPLLPEINLDFDLVTFEMFEENTVGADIRNKLTPLLNLIALLKLYDKEKDSAAKGVLWQYVETEMKKSEESIKYISNLL